MTLYETAMELLETYGNARVSIEWTVAGTCRSRHYIHTRVLDIPIMHAMREVDFVQVDRPHITADKTDTIISIYLKEVQHVY